MALHSLYSRSHLWGNSNLVCEGDDAEVHSHALAIAVEAHHGDQVVLMHRDETISEQLAISGIPAERKRGKPHVIARWLRHSPRGQERSNNK